MSNTEVVIAIRNQCNYNCDYCVGHNNKQKTVLHNLDKLTKVFQKIGSFTVTNFECGSGEPTIHPQIKSMIEICAQYGAVSIPTNNSINPDLWLPSSFSKNILVRMALHPIGEKDVKGFTDRALKISNSGASVSIVFVAHPDRLNKIESYKEHFSKNGLRFQLSAFIGDHAGLHYPESYTDSEKILLGLGHNSDWYQRLHTEMTIRNFKNIPCIAGQNFLYIDGDARLLRCLYDTESIEEPFTETVPCRVEKCGCRLLLKDLNTHTPDFWNQYRKMCGYPLLENSPRSNEDIYQEKSKVYWTLMKKYGKTNE
jgi:organic radical activating enzyme